MSDTALTTGRRLLMTGLFCLGAAWIAGAAPRFGAAFVVLLIAPGYVIERLINAGRPPLLIRSMLWIGLSASVVALLYQLAWVLNVPLGLLPLSGLVLAVSVAAAVLAWSEAGRPQSEPSANFADGGGRPRIRADHEAAPNARIGRADRECSHECANKEPSADDADDADGAGRVRSERSADDADAAEVPTAGGGSGVWALFGVICLLTLVLRFVQVADLALPAWVDPVHHALMVRVAAERGMAPVNLNPYLPVAELPYHWGYHVLIAAAHTLSGYDLPAALLWSGQVLNALQAVAAGALALLFWRNPAAAVVAALITGLVSIFPAYYATWGRYTQLAGLLLLPGLAAAWAYALGPRNNRSPGVSQRGWWIVAALLLAGLSLIHFRVLIFGLVLIAAQSVVWALGVPLQRIGRTLVPAALTAIGSIVLAAPWLALLVRRTLLPAIPQPENLVGDSSYTALSLGLLWAGQNRMLVALALLGGFLLLWQRKRVTLIVLGWVAGMVILANPALLTYLLPALGVPLLVEAALRRDWRPAVISVPLLLLNPWLVRLPATWLINNDAVTITLFLPLSMLIGGGAAALYARLQRRSGARRGMLARFAAILTLAVALWGGWQSREVLNRSTIFATAADLAAINWVAANTEADARFLINAAPWLGASDRGVDGGWWLLPLIGRWTSTPPVLFIYGELADIEAARERSRTVITFQPGQEPTIEALIAREGIDYLYFGVQPGPLRPEYFRDRPGFELVYEQDGVTILAVSS